MQEDEMLKIKRKKKKEIDFKLHSKYSHSTYISLTFKLSRKHYRANLSIKIINFY